MMNRSPGYPYGHRFACAHRACARDLRLLVGYGISLAGLRAYVLCARAGMCLVPARVLVRELWACEHGGLVLVKVSRAPSRSGPLSRSGPPRSCAVVMPAALLFSSFLFFLLANERTPLHRIL